MSKQIKLWEGDFGNDYSKRNTFTEKDIERRQYMWRCVLNAIVSSAANPGRLIPSSYTEIGAGNGQNIVALHEMHEDSTKPKFIAIEPNLVARRNLVSQKKDRNIDLTIHSYNWLQTEDDQIQSDLVFTSGVLIHVHPDDLVKFMKKMYVASSKYIVIAEYFSAECRQIKYRDTEDTLWTNDFGRIFMENIPGVRCMGYSFMWKYVTGLDNLTVWMFEKVN